MTITPEIILAILGTGGLASIVGAGVNGYLARRKLGAEATQIITQAAGGVVELMNEELARAKDNLTKEAAERARLGERVRNLEQAQEKQRQEFEAEMRAREIVWQRVEKEWREALQLHVAWDEVAILKMQEAGVELPPAPPLYPPRTYSRG